jgi:DNA-binding response OmpR family regulator
MLPGLDGFEVCKRLRKATTLPVIMLTARGDEVDRVVGLELGADDYLAKPFSPRELLARIRAVLRRGRAEAELPDQLSHGSLFVDRARRQIRLGETPVELTAYQFDVLWALLESAERVLSRDKLYNRIRELRGEPPADFDPAVDRSIDVHVSNVRQALASAGDTGDGLIRTVRGVGYVLGGE